MSLISTWSTVPNANGTLGSTPFYWPEGQAPSTVNDCARLMMATIRTQWNDAVWFNWGYTVTRVSGTSFTVVTASWNTVTLPAAFEANGRIKLFDTSTMYGTISTVSASAASTLVTFTPDGGSLTSSFSSVANSIISATNTPIPGLNIPTNIITQTTQQIFAVDTGATNSAQITLSPVLGSYVTGQLLTFKAAATNTGATTLEVDALGNIPIKKQGGSTDVVAGDIMAGQTVTVVYDGTNFEMQSQVGNASGGGGASAASQAEMEAASSTTVYSSPGRQQFHPGHPKVCGYATVSGGIYTLQPTGSYNITSISKTATGKINIVVTTNFSSTNYGMVADTSTVANNFYATVTDATPAINNFDLGFADTSGNYADPTSASWMAFGDQ